MRRWEHRVSEEWLRARKGVLSATDIKKLVPAYKRVLKKKPKKDEIIPDFAAVWCEKNTDTGDIDTSSPSYAAARGHIMEPYAIHSWNMNGMPAVNHWDDCVVTNGIIGFSPDALDVLQPVESVSISYKDIDPLLGVEVKSYGPDHHIQCCLEGKFDHKEIMQIAVAFAVCPNLGKMALLFFCPDAPISMHADIYTREDLADEIKMVLGIAAEYERNAKLLSKVKGDMEAKFTEQQIWDEYVKERAEFESMLVQ